MDDQARVLCVQRTGWGKSAVYFIAAALLRERGAGPALIVSPLLALMRNQIAAAERLGIRAHTINSTNRDAWAEVRGAARGRCRRPAADQPRAARQPAVPLGHAAAVLAARRPAGDRRGALHQRLGARLPARLPAPGGDARAAARRAWPCCARRRPRTTAWSPTSRSSCARTCGPTAGRSAARACGWRSSTSPGQADRLAWLADLAAAAAGLRHRLHAHQARRRAGRRLAERPRDRGRGLLRRGRERAADRGRGAAAAQRPQGGGGHQRAGHGLRQARPRLRRALPGAGLGHLLLPAGRAAPAAASSAPRSCSCAAPRTAGSRTSSSSRRSRRASWSTACSSGCRTAAPRRAT